MEETSGLTASEQAFFESGGQADPESVESTSSEQTENESQNSNEQQTEQTQAQPNQQAPEQKQEKQEKMVSIHALHQARMENKEMREKLTSMERTFQEFQKRFAPPEPQIPDLSENPVAHFQAKTQLLEQTIQELNKRLESGTQEQRNREQQMVFERNVAALEHQFKSVTPDYDDATVYLKQSIASDLLNQGVLPNEIPAIIDNQLNTMVYQMLNAGINPAQIAYQMAQAKGFKPKSAQATEQKQLQAQQSAQVQNQQKIESINKGQAAAKSLSSTGGKGKPELTLEAMAEMDADELEKHWSQISKLM